MVLRLRFSAFAFCLLCLALVSSGCKSRDQWVSLFDGNSLEGWQTGENPGSVSIADGELVCHGPRTHLFYMGEVNGADFRNFDFTADVMARHGSNSGIYFHTTYQKEGWPEKGFEVQVNNTQQADGDYYEFKKTGSLYGIRNLYKQMVRDDEWFTMMISVRGNHVTTRINDQVITDYVSSDTSFQSSHGTFALQCHDPGSEVHFKNIQVRPLPDDVQDEQKPLPAPDDSLSAQVLQLSRDNFPLIDFHVHLKGGLRLDSALAVSRRLGINYGIAPNCGKGFYITDDKGIYTYLDSLKGQPVFVGMQAEGREWVTMFSKEAIARFDYVFTDAMTFTDDNGKRMRLWMDDEVGEIPDPQQFMDLYVRKITEVIENEPIDIYVNPTFLPNVIDESYDMLWTEARMKKVIDAAVKNDVAIEINSRYRIPSARFLTLAKEAGVKFSCGTNNAAADLGRADYCLKMIREIGLSNKDMFMPRPDSLKMKRLQKLDKFQKQPV